MVLLKRTERIDKLIEAYQKETHSNEKITIDLKSHTIDHKHLVQMYSAVGKSRHSSLLELLQGSQIDAAMAKAPERPKSKEFIELTARLRERQKEEEYQQLVRESGLGSSTEASDPLSPGAMMKEVREQLTTIANILISVGSVCWALWYWTGSSMSNMSLAHRTLICLLGGIVILVAEVVIYGRYKFKVEDARVVERAMVEEKVVINSTTFKQTNNALIKDAETKPISITKPGKSQAPTIRKRRSKKV